MHTRVDQTKLEAVRLSEPEAAALASASLDHAWPLVELFSTIRREHPDDGNRAALHIVERLKTLGVPVTVHEPELYLTLPKGAHVEAAGRRMFARPAPMTRPAPGGVAAPLAFVEKPINPPAGWGPSSARVFGAGYDPAPGTPDLAGKIAVYRGMISSERIMGFHALGAVGVIAVNPGDYAHWGGGSATWGTADLDDLPSRPAIPAVAVNRPDGDALIALAAQGGSAQLVTAFEEGWFRSLLPVVEIRANASPSASCCCTGITIPGTSASATTRPAMPACWKSPACCGSTATGSSAACASPGGPATRPAGSPASTWYADEFALDLARNCLAHLNCDSPGCRDATDYIMIPWMAENAGFVRGVVRDAAGKAAEGKRPSQSSDFSFNNLGITGFFSSSSRIPKKEIERRGYYYVMGNGGNLEWHTDDDLMPVADRDVLLIDIKVYLLAVFRLANAALLPWDWRALLKEFDATLMGYDKAAGMRFDLSPARDAVAALDAALARFADAAAAGHIEPAAANDALLALSRLLVPLNYTRGTAGGATSACRRPP